MKYTVHIYATVRVPIEIEADSPAEATVKADAEFFADGPFGPTNMIKAKGECADEISGFQVDWPNDDTHKRSQAFTPDHQPDGGEHPYLGA
jgi:hypothetical protein